MKRLVNPAIEGGVPYMNMDFSDVLQIQHIKSYSAMLDGLNDVPLESAEMDRGIILSGLEVLSYDTNSFITTLSLTSSFVYIPGLTGYGDFFEPNPILLGSDLEVFTKEFYIVPISTFEKRYLKSGSNEDIVEIKYFDVVVDRPTNTPYIKFNEGKTSRNYSRVLKYKLSTPSQVFITSNISNFNQTTGIGEGDMYGFALCDGQTFNTNYGSSITTLNMKGRYALGYDSETSETPNDNTDIITDNGGVPSKSILNYAKVGNIGGGIIRNDTNFNGVKGKVLPSAFIRANELPRHNHGGNTGFPDDVNHQHSIQRGDWYEGQGPNAAGYATLHYTGAGRDEIIEQRYYEENRDENSRYGPLRYHTHNITGGDYDNHETRPPYMVFAYYQKIELVY